MRIVRNKTKYIGKNKVFFDVPEKELMVSDEGMTGLDITAITYDRTSFLANPEFKEFGINIHLTLEETLELEKEIIRWKDRILSTNKRAFAKYKC